MKVQSKFNYGEPKVYTIERAIERKIINQENTNEQINKMALMFGQLVEELHRKGSIGKKGVLRLLPGMEEANAQD